SSSTTSSTNGFSISILSVGGFSILDSSSFPLLYINVFSRFLLKSSVSNSPSSFLRLYHSPLS
ncbi:MAG TPA: hypothetical protein QF889_00640, partial [Flavobacteriaceae bacterium]|nr:hypothetical protein [Flavobacteriaceae bacterium]